PPQRAPKPHLRNLHVRPDPQKKKNGPVIDFVGHRLNKNRTVQITNAALDYTIRVAQNPELPAPRRVKLSTLRYRRYLAQHAHDIEAPFLERDRVPRQRGDPRHLGFDFIHELADLRCRGFGLLALNLNE